MTWMQPKNKGSHFIVLDSFNLLQAAKQASNPCQGRNMPWPEAVCAHPSLQGPMHPPVAIYPLTVAHETPIYMRFHADKE